MGWILVSFLIAVIKYHSKSNLMEKGLILATVEGTVHHDKASGTEGRQLLVTSQKAGIDEGMMLSAPPLRFTYTAQDPSRWLLSAM